jgi:hypothetical protein
LSSSAWDQSTKRWLISIDHGITEPGAVEALSLLSKSEVRIPNGTRVLEDPRLRPPTAFHTKAYLFRARAGLTPTSLVVGSANLTDSALAVGAEIVTVQMWAGQLTPVELSLIEVANDIEAWFEEAWDAADALTKVLPYYRSRYQAGEVTRDDALPATQAYWEPSPVADGATAAQLAAARALWFEVHALYRNRGAGNPGNQLDTPRGTRVFFGFSAAAVPCNTVLGEVVIQVQGGYPSITRTVRYGNNQMDKVNLPVPGVDGPESYDESFLVFERASQAGIEPRRFRLVVANESMLVDRISSASRAVELRMQGGRRYGLLF